MSGRSGKSTVTAGRPLEWMRADEEHVRKLAKGPLGKALSLDQIRSLYATSLGLPDPFGVTPAFRERVAAAQMLTVNVIPRPKSDDSDGSSGGVTFIVDPFGENVCPACGHRFVQTSDEPSDEPSDENTTTTQEEEKP